MKNWLTLITPLVLTSLLLAACGGVAPIPAPGIGSTITSDKDGMTLLYVPAGKFIMGDKAEDALVECKKYDSGCQLNWFMREQPPHEVYLDTFWIDQTKVTNSMYAKCVSVGACKAPTYKNSAIHSNYYGNSEFDNYPVIYVDWNMAKTYCAWAGRQLPTEAQWEKAARGTDGRTYPWGNSTPNKDLLNSNGNIGDTTNVGSYESGKSPYGLYDMAGNVWEWLSDWYSDTYYQNSPSSNPLGPDTGQWRVLRGGSWGYFDYGTRSAYRSYGPPNVIVNYVGFRCARSLP